MKYAILLFGLLFCSASFNHVYGQEDQLEVTDSTLYKLTKNDGTIYIGYVVKQDAREVLLRTREIGDLYIPKHEIKSLEPVKESELSKDGQSVLVEDAYSSRYYFSTSGLPIGAKRQYVVFNWYGPEYHAGVGEHLDLGVMTSWLGAPILLSAKYSIPLSDRENAFLGIGTLLGTVSWARPQSVGGLPYVALTFGTGVTNVTFSGGYAFWSDPEWDNTWNQPMGSISSLIRMNNKLSFVFESLLFLAKDGDDETVTMLTPGLRFNTGPSSAFQFGFSAIGSGGELFPFPFPNLSWYRSF